MKHISINEGDLHVSFRIRENGVVELAHFTSGEKTSVAPAVSEPILTDTQPKSEFEPIPADTLPEAEPNEEPNIYYPIIEVQETGKTTRNYHGYKHNHGSTSLDFRYRDHTITENEKGRLLTINLTTAAVKDQDLTRDSDPAEIKAASPAGGLCAAYHMQFFTGIPVVQVWTVLANNGEESAPLEYVSSFIYRNLCGEGVLPYYEKTDILIPRSSWYAEAQWQKCDARDLNLSVLPIKGYNCPGQGRNEYSYTGKGSWSSSGFLPMGMTMDRETGETYIFQIEHSGQWHVEYGSDDEGKLYVALSGATDMEHSWWLDLIPGRSFTTVPIAFGVVKGDESAAVAALTRYRRAIRRKSEESEALPVIFNDYMNCLMGDPYEEKEKQIIDLAAEIGCEYFCLDAGWYDDGYWWDRVGEWKESTARFPNGLRSVYDYARSKGLKMGMWLEIEVMGTACPLAKDLPDDWFVCRHGRRHVDDKRYLLDFRNPAVREYCDKVIDRLVEDYGCEYFKIDYNVSMGNGSDLNTDSCAQAIRDHYENLYQWYQGIFARHPQLVIENCGSGGQRMDYGMMKLLNLQSTSDQTDSFLNSFIAINAASAVVPEQAGMWVYPYEDDREHVIYNMVNGLLLRPYISGKVWDLSPENLALMKEGISLYKEIRGQVKEAVPFFPLGFASTKDKDMTALAYGLKHTLHHIDPDREKEGDALASGPNHTDCIYLAVLAPFTDTAEIPLDTESCGIPGASGYSGTPATSGSSGAPGASGYAGAPGASDNYNTVSASGNFAKTIRDIRVIYPASEDCEYRIEEGVLRVKMPQKGCGRLFRIEFES